MEEKSQLQRRNAQIKAEAVIEKSYQSLASRDDLAFWSKLLEFMIVVLIVHQSLPYSEILLGNGHCV